MSDWFSRGLCAEVDPELHFPEKGGSAKPAKRICMACQVRAECLAYALADPSLAGIWGGKSERERREMRRRELAA